MALEIKGNDKAPGINKARSSCRKSIERSLRVDANTQKNGTRRSIFADISAEGSMAHHKPFKDDKMVRGVS
jgi:hypothetical protein